VMLLHHPELAASPRNMLMVLTDQLRIIQEAAAGQRVRGRGQLPDSCTALFANMLTSLSAVAAEVIRSGEELP
jgi:hypothetical protein